MFAPTVGGGISTMPPAAERTHTAPIDGAMTFDSPFSAVLLAVWELGISLSPPLLVRAGAFLHGHGQIAARGRRSERRRRVPVPLCSRWRDDNPFTTESCPPDDGGDRRA